jgi:carbon-monoxide dehydrogenase large subunit
MDGRRELGAARPRREDTPLLQGTARFTDDFQPPDALHLAVLRSQYGHAQLQTVQTADAE